MNKKKLTFLVDVGVGKKIEEWLVKEGFDTKSIRDLDPRMPDYEILKIASSDQRMVLTMDKDFGELVYSSNMPHTGVLLMRLEDYNGAEKLAVIQKILYEHQEEIIGKFCVFKDNKLRIRK